MHKPILDYQECLDYLGEIEPSYQRNPTLALPRPNGACFCGCGSSVAPGSYFKIGHDKKAEGDMNALHHEDSVVQRIVDLGYGPTGRNLHEEAIRAGVREPCGIGSCNVSGKGRWIMAHRQRPH